MLLLIWKVLTYPGDRDLEEDLNEMSATGWSVYSIMADWEGEDLWKVIYCKEKTNARER